MKTWISKLKFAAFLATVPLGADLFAQGPQCAAPQCVAPQCAAPCAPNCYRPTATPQGIPQGTPQGLFVPAPPRGVSVGESNSYVLHGPGLHFAPASIRLPSFQLPGLARSRRDAEMITEPSHASFQPEAPLQLQVRPQAAPQAVPQGAPQGVPQGVPQATPNCTVPAPPCFGQNAMPQNGEIVQLQQQVAQLTALVGQLAALQQAQSGQVPVAQVSPVQPAGYYQPTAMRQVQQPVAPTSPSAAEQQMLEQYEMKCRELAAMQEQLAATQWEYQALLEAKQQNIVQDRDARMRKQLGEQVAAGREPSVPSKSATVAMASPARTRQVESNDEMSAREPLRLRGQARPVDSRAAIDTPAEAAPVLEDREEATEEAAPTGSKFGRWLKRTK